MSTDIQPMKMVTSQAAADHRFLLFVVDPDAYKALSHRSFSSQAPGVEVVDLVSQNAFVYPLPHTAS